ncbi:glutamate-1-semialdehyde 2,1-aminomutase [Methanolobus vulcani]|jgi:Glutamate-1-semialdehyde aminotransferase|uniref:Glutamate-1-semialdehyde 2,1-aminomutase n=1 Tax=Methanolobus vulcani TaxID=38026 RepID=A0A7Z7FDX8_9EURY|nr:aminotransferase class III-fold pyridoxal phosphate-dependent enzyme [Methanolobus vulcani]SDF57897.1 glutamate-1-semialdehyde 2,1-aminomutase [Methanolobus vulcani]
MVSTRKGVETWNRAKKIIPGGSQLLSKRSEMFLPDIWPSYYKKAEGVEVWDLDDNRFIDMSLMGVGSCVLGYSDEDVNKAVKSAVDNGSMCTLNAPEEVELAELLIKLHPWADMVRYARTGGEAMSIAVRIARAKSGKEIVLFCGYHGWHDWYLSSNLADEKSLDGHLLPGLNPRGVPRNLKGLTLPFNYNDTEGFMKLIAENKNHVGVVVLESIRNNYPNKEFIETIRRVTREMNIILVVDEITAGFRLNNGGAHLILDFEPDIAVFAKGISNGFPMAAIIGKMDVMEASQDTFISSTYWTDRVGPTAALATINKFIDENVAMHLASTGKKVMDGWKQLADDHNIDIEISGIDPLGHFEFKNEKPLVFKTLVTQLMLEKGFLATNAFYASYAHKDVHIGDYLSALDLSFELISKIIHDKSKPEKYLNGSVCQSGFKRLT